MFGRFRLILAPYNSEKTAPLRPALQPLARRLLAAVTLAGLLSPLLAVRSNADEIARGEELAKRMCAVCHLNPGQGDKTGPSSVPGFVAVAKRPGQTLDGIISWLRSTPSMMPDHHLSQDEMEALAFYILSLRDAPEVAPGGPPPN